MTSSLLPDWHFAGQLGLSPGEMSLFLTIIDALRRPGPHDSAAVSSAIDELALLERWAHVYALPDVLRHLRSVESERARTIIANIIDPIIGGAPRESVASLLADAISAFARGAIDDALGFLEEACRDRDLRFRTPRTPSYIDIEDFGIEALVLSILLVAGAEAPAAVTSALGRGDEEGDAEASMESLFAACLQGTRGRWCFLLAIDLCLSIPELALIDEIEAAMDGQTALARLSEPDFIRRWIALRLVFTQRRKGHRIRRILDDLSQELLLFREWRSLVSRSHRDLEGILTEFPNALTFWQDAIWDALLQIDPVEAARRLSAVWLPRAFLFPDVNHPIALGSAREMEPIRVIHERLAKQMDFRPRFLVMKPGPTTPSPGHWIALSPWIVAPLYHRRPTEHTAQADRGEDDDQGPDELHTSQLLRCLAAAHFGARLLLTAGERINTSPDWRYFGAHMLHAVRTWNSNERDFDPAKIGASPTRQAAVLMHVLATSLEKVAGGRFRNPAPEYFFDLVTAAYEERLIDPIPSGLIAKTNDLKVVSDTLVASGLHLIAYAMIAAGEDEGRGRWLRFVHRICEFKTKIVHDRHISSLRKVLQRYLVTPTPSPEVWADDALSQVRRSGSWKVSHRQLLLTTAESAQEWHLPNILVHADASQVWMLARGCQRVAAAVRDQNCDDALRAKWIRELTLELAQVGAATPMDRFLRVRLVELIRDGTMSADRDLLTASFSRLIEFGQSSDFRRLVEDSYNEIVTTQQQFEVRRVRFKIVQQYRWRNIGNHIAEAGDPDRRRDQWWRDRWVDRLYASFICAGRPDQEEAARRLAEEGREQRDAALSGRRPNPGTPINTKTSIDGDVRLAYSRDDGLYAVAAAVVVDRNHESARIADPAWADEKLLNMFSQPQSAVTRQADYLGVALSSNRHEGVTELEIALDRSHTVTARSDAAAIRSGDYLSVQLPWFNFRRDVELKDVRQVRQLELGNNPVRRRARVQLESPAGLPVKLRAFAEPDDRPIDWSQRTSNFLAFHGALADRDVSVYLAESNDPSDAEASVKAQPEPLLLDFVDLLLDHCDAAEPSASIILCIQLTPLNPLDSIIVDVSPTQCYELFLESDFTRDARDAILRRLREISDRGDNPSGLLVAVEVAPGTEGPRLALSHSLSRHASSILAYPADLSAPFDERNLRWRRLFMPPGADEYDKDEPAQFVLTAERTGHPSSAIANLGGLAVPGFPDKVRVDVTETYQRRAEQQFRILIDSTSWNPRTATVRGERVEESHLAVDEHNLDSVASTILNITAGDRLEVKPLRSVNRSAEITGLTTYNLRVFIAAESLSMLPLFEPISFRPRTVEVTKVEWAVWSVQPDVDPTTIPERSFEGDIATGILLSIPESGAAGRVTTVVIAWRCASGFVQSEVEIHNLAEVQGAGRDQRRGSLAQGARLTVTRRGSVLSALFDVPLIRTEALWERNDESAIDDESIRYVGEARLKGDLYELFEAADGIFTARVKLGDSSAPRTDKARFFRESGLRTPRGRNGSSYRGRIRFELQSADGNLAILCGRSYDSRLVDDGELFGIGLSIQETRADSADAKLYQLRRELRVLPITRHVPIASPAALREGPVSLTLDEARARQMAHWRDTLEPLEGQHDCDAKRLLLQVAWRRLFPAGLEVIEDRISRVLDRSLVTEYLKGDARGVIIDQSPAVSYIDVAPLALSDLRDALDRPAFDEKVYLKLPSQLRIFYAGCRPNRDGGRDSVEHEHIFEWGFGYWVAVPESNLRFQDEPIRAGDLRFFNGDRISALKFIKQPPTVQNPIGDLLLSIEDVSLSTAHRLYLQARDYRIVHTVHVRVPRRGQAEIAYVEGFEARSPGDGARRPFVVSRARLNEAGSQVLTQRAQLGLSDSNGWEGVILGRFDRQAYERSFGRDVIFTHTRLSLTPQAGSGHLTENERFFALTNRIRPYGDNDIAITLQHIPGLHLDDIGPEFGSRVGGRETFLVPRRRFSYAEDMLNRLQRELDGDHGLRYVMVRLTVGRDGAIYYIRDGTPPRRPEVLDSLSKEAAGGVSAIFAGPVEEGRDDYRFELRPGVIIDLAFETVDMPVGMLRGDVVRIVPYTVPDVRSGGAGRRRYRIKRATYSDIRYAEARRPVVALPMQNLKRDTPPTGNMMRAANSFTIGDFPGPKARLRILNSHQGDNTPRHQYRLPSRDDFLAFMSTRHPKLAWLQQTEQTEEQWAVVITPDFTRRIHAGRLKIDWAQPHESPSELPPEAIESGEQTNCRHGVSVEALPNASQRLSETRTDWFYLTFRDETAAAMEKLIETQTWKYHDKVSINWAVDRRTGEVVSETPVIGPMRALEGPLFFEIRDGIAILRYSEGELPLHAIGYKNLLSHLAGDNGESLSELRCAVAGVSRDPTGEYAGVYLEVLPGRIVEVPPEMARWHCDSGTVDLTLLSWHLFAPGDRVNVSKLQQIDRYAPERVRLEWAHGVRNAFGPLGAILPKCRDATSIGAALYGHDKFAISIPTTAPDRLPECALIGGAGNVQPVPRQERELRGATVLLVRGVDARVEILGFEDWRALADRDWNWSEDTLMKPVVSPGHDGTASTSETKLLERIDLAGGALPVTIEAAFRPPRGSADEGRRPTLFFSRRHQDPGMKEGQIAVAQVLGRIPVSGWIMLGIGGRSFAIPGDRLVLGAPDRLSEPIVDYLTRHATQVWVRRTKGGYEVGVAAPRKDRTSSAPVGIPDLGDGKFHGLICVDNEERTLRWLPATQAAAAPLTAEQAAAVFGDPRLQLSASVMPDRSLSLLGDRKARQELNQLKIGCSLRVEELDGTGIGCDFLPASRVRPEGEFCLVRSRTGGVIMAAVLPKRPANTPPRTLIAEVAERQVDEGETRILLVASGARRVIPDFPNWIALNGVGASRNDDQRVLNGDDILGGVTPRTVVRSFVEYLGCGTVSLSNRDLVGFKRGYRNAQTVSLLAGVAAACLDAVESRGTATGAPRIDFDFVRDLGHRILRSFHLEILGRRSVERQAGIIPTSESNSVTHGVDRLLGELVAGISPSQCSNALRHLVDCLALDGGTAHDREVVNALAAAIGEPVDLHALIEDAETLANAARIVRPILVCDPERIRCVPECFDDLVRIGRTLIESNTDIPLLEPLVRMQ